MKPGDIITQRDRSAWLVLACSSIGWAIAPIGTFAAGDRQKAGDVFVGDYVVRTCGVRLVPRLDASPIGRVTPPVLANCVREASRSAGTMQTIARHASLATWHREASNERTACR